MNALLLMPKVSLADNDDDQKIPFSQEIMKPRAPVEALIPATKVRVNLNRALELAKQLSLCKRGDVEIQAEMRHILLDKEIYRVSTEVIKKNSKREDSIPSLLPTTSIYDKAYSEQLKKMSPAEALVALPVQLGERGTAARLKRRQSNLSKSDPIRGAFNYYTSQIQFNTEVYTLNATGEEKKQLIRNEALPDITSVIVSDLDLRDLSRNSILDLWEDAAAEFSLQEKELKNGNDFTSEELIDVLTKAVSACDTWFGFIPAEDVAEAIALEKSF